MKIPQVGCCGIKTNIPKRETKDEPQTNGSYKIRQIIIKIMEYIHIHIHPRVKSKQSNKTKIQTKSSADKDYHLTQPCPSVEKQTNKNLSTNLTLYEAYKN